MNLASWLRSLGLEQYEAAFRENAIDNAVLPNLTAEDLKDLGVGLVGHRRKLLDAIAALRTDASAEATSADDLPAIDKPPSDVAERRQVTVMFPTWWVRRRSPWQWTRRILETHYVQQGQQCGRPYICQVWQKSMVNSVE